MSKPTVSIIFPTFNGWEDTKKCLASISKLDYPWPKIEVIVVDNASTDKTVLFLHQQFPHVKLLPQKKNLGFGKAVNLGIKNSKGDCLLITNNDVVFEKNYLKILVDFLQKNPNVGIAGGKVYYKKPKEKIAFPGAKFSFYTGNLKPHKNPNRTSETDWIPGCNLLVKREILDEIGYLDEKFFFYFEDLDLALRAKKAGWKVIYYPKAVLWHGEGAAIDRENWRKKSEFYYQGKTRILFKHGTKLQLLSSLLFQFFLGLPYQVLVLKHQNYPPAFEALIKNIKDFASDSKVLKEPDLSSVLKKKQKKIISQKDLPSVTIIFPTLNGRHLITRVLNSIENLNYPREKIETIVVDNASTDGTPEIISLNFPWVKLIRLSRNTGSAPPITLGAKIAKGKYVLATNDDVTFEKNCLYELMRLMLSDGRIGIATGKMLNFEPPYQPIFLSSFRINLYLGYHPVPALDFNKIQEFDWASGACILIRKKLFKDVGYFDDAYIFCGDDYDVGFQVRRFGFKVIYNPHALYYHALSTTKRKDGPSQESLFAHYRGKFRFMLKNATPLQMLTFFPTQIIFGPFYSYFKFGHKTFIPQVKALIWNARHFQETLKARQKAKQRRQKKKSSSLVILILIIFLGLFLRIAFLDNRPPTYDEAISLALAKAPIIKMIKGTVADVHPPLYFLLLHFWLKIKASLLFLRFLSVLLGTLLVLAMAVLGQKLFDTKVGLVSAFLAAVSPVFIFESVNLRMYPLAILESLLSLYFFLSFLKKQDLSSLVFLGFFLFFGLYTHYYFVLIIFIFNFFFFLNLRKYRKVLARWFCLQTSLFLLFSPLLMLYLTSAHPKVLPVSHSILKIPGVFVIFAVSWDAIQILNLFPFRPSLLNIPIFLLTFGLLATFLNGLRHLRENKERLAFFLIFLFLPIGLVFLISLLVKPFFGVRSFILFSPVYYLVGSLGLAKLKKKGLLGGLALFIFLSGAFLLAEYHGFRARQGPALPYRFVKENLSLGDLFVHSDPYTLVTARYLLGDSNQLAAVPSWLSPEMEEAIGYHLFSSEKIKTINKHLWYFFLGTQSYNKSMAEKKQKEFEKNYPKIISHQFQDPEMKVTLFDLTKK